MRSRNLMGRTMLLLVVVLPLSGCMKDTRNCLDDNSCETAAPTESTRLIRFPFYYCHGASEDGASNSTTSNDGASNSPASNDTSWDCSQEAAAHKITTMPAKTDTEATKEATKEDADSEETADPEEADSEEAP